MPNLLSRGATWLTDKLHDQESVVVTYRRGQASVTLSATLGSQLLLVSDRMGNTKVERTSRDFIVRAADLVLSGVTQEPHAGDRVDVANADGTFDRFEVMAPAGEAPWRYADPYKKRLRIHGKFLGVVESWQAESDLWNTAAQLWN